jgi:antitoxin ParD1/3/4/toxin ParE1/3/4
VFPYKLSPDALQDLGEIWDFISLDSATAADKQEDEFFEAFDNLGRHPGMGHTRTDLTERDVRFWPVGSYLVVYRRLHSQLEIVAVLQGSRDVAQVIRRR